MKNKPQVGQTLYSLNVGNSYRRGVEQKLTPMVVTEVGRKYFTLKADINSWREVKFSLENWREKTEYCVNHELYETVEEWEPEKEESRICRAISDAFEYGKNKKNLSIDKLHEIDKLLNEND